MRETIVCDMPISRAMVRVLQWVAPAGDDSSVLIITASIRVSSMPRGAPGHGASSRSSRRCSTKRARHLDTICGVIRWRAAPLVVNTVSAHPSTMRACKANARAVLWRNVNATSCSRSDSLNTSCTLNLPLIASFVLHTLHDRLSNRSLVQRTWQCCLTRLFPSPC